MTIEAYVAGLDADIIRLKTQKAEFVERRARMWSRWGTEPFVEFHRTTDCRPRPTDG